MLQTQPKDNPNEHKTEFVMEAGINTMKLLEGAYSCITLVKGVGLVAFRDPHGIRPLVLGRRRNPDGTTDYCVASEDCAFGPIAFERVRLDGGWTVHAAAANGLYLAVSSAWCCVVPDWSGWHHVLWFLQAPRVSQQSAVQAQHAHTMTISMCASWDILC
jgi:hypothetical protein